MQWKPNVLDMAPLELQQFGVQSFIKCWPCAQRCLSLQHLACDLELFRTQDQFEVLKRGADGWTKAAKASAFRPFSRQGRHYEIRRRGFQQLRDLVNAKLAALLLLNPGEGVGGAPARCQAP